LDTCVKVDIIKDELWEKGWNIATSNDAGRYLCEFVLGTSLACLSSKNVFFVHLPPVDAPYSQDQLDEALDEIVKSALANNKIVNFLS
jgi:pyrrolidone-carboxylate peptidase